MTLAVEEVSLDDDKHTVRIEHFDAFKGRICNSTFAPLEQLSSAIRDLSDYVYLAFNGRLTQRS